LILTGGNEELCPMSKCVEAIGRATGGAVHEPGTGFGDFWAGTARRLLMVNGVNHLTEVADPTVTRRVIQWFGSSLDIDAGAVDGRWLALLNGGIVAATLGGVSACTWFLAGFGARLLPTTIVKPQPWYGGRLALLLILLIGMVPGVAAVARWVEAGPAYFAGPSLVLVSGVALCCLLVAVAGKWRLSHGGISVEWLHLGSGVALGLLSLGTAFVWLGLPWGSTWMELMPSRQRFALALVLWPLLFPACLALTVAVPRLVGGASERKQTRLITGLVWVGIALAVWAGFVLFVADHWPLFGVPAGFLSASFLVPLPLWLAPNRKGMATARAVSHSGAGAWLLACHLPFVQC
jgi:hypothetical protein